jgi:hypothetical protein
MNSTETKTHLQDKMRNGLAEHLATDHGITNLSGISGATVPRTRQAQHKLHIQLHADQPAQDAQSSRDASVLAGVTRKPAEQPAANQPKPKPAARKKTEDVPLPADKPAASKPTSKPETPVQTAKRTARSKPAASKPEVKAEDKPATNGASPRQHNQKLAVMLVDMVAEKFADSSTDDQIKVANWMHALPTGGAGWQRYWPAGFARPTSAGWRVPEGETLPE